MKRVLHSPEDRDKIFQRFCAYLEEWKIRLVLREWDITLHRESGGLECAHGTLAGGQTQTWAEYQRAFISLHVPDDSEWEDTELEDTAVHELMHVLVSPLVAGYRRAHKGLSRQTKEVLQVFEEQLCTRLALGFLRTKYPRRKAHWSSSDGQKQVSPRRRQSPQ